MDIFYFKESEPRFATCNICKKDIPRGSETATAKEYSTSSLHKLLKNTHHEQYSEMDTQTILPKNETPMQKKKNIMEKQFTLMESYESTEVWYISHPKSIEIHEKFLKMIALDNQSFSIVEDYGFIEKGCSQNSETCLKKKEADFFQKLAKNFYFFTIT